MKNFIDWSKMESYCSECEIILFFLQNKKTTQEFLIHTCILNCHRKDSKLLRNMLIKQVNLSLNSEFAYVANVVRCRKRSPAEAHPRKCTPSTSARHRFRSIRATYFSSFLTEWISENRFSIHPGYFQNVLLSTLPWAQRMSVLSITISATFEIFLK